MMPHLLHGSPARAGRPKRFGKQAQPMRRRPPKPPTVRTGRMRQFQQGLLKARHLRPPALRQIAPVIHATPMRRSGKRQIPKRRTTKHQRMNTRAPTTRAARVLAMAIAVSRPAKAPAVSKHSRLATRVGHHAKVVIAIASDAIATARDGRRCRKTNQSVVIAMIVPSAKSRCRHFRCRPTSRSIR